MEQKVKEAREWLLSGGGGYEGGEDGLRAMTVTGPGLIDFLASFYEHLAMKFVVDMASMPERTKHWGIVDEVFPSPPNTSIFWKDNE